MRRPRLEGEDATAREAQVAEVMLGAALHIKAGERALVIDDQSGEVERALAARGVIVTRWCRMSTAEKAGTPWPEGAHHDIALMRLPRAKESFHLALHAAHGALREGGELRVCGANDEGIKSSGRWVESVFGAARALDARRHCRVWGARRTTLHSPAEPHATLAAWRTEVSPSPVPSRPRWVTYPGVFARGGIDDGTTMLLGALPSMSGLRVLDFAAGGGVIAAELLDTLPAERVWMLEADAIALSAARENVPEAGAILSDGWNRCPKLEVDRIVSNPPIHRGKSEDLSVVRALIDGAPQRLGPGGELWMVVQQQVPAHTLFDESWRVSLAVEDGRFRVWRAERLAITLA